MTSSFIRKPKIGSTDPIDVSRIISFLDKESNEKKQEKPRKAVIQVIKKKSDDYIEVIEPENNIDEEIQVLSELPKKETRKTVAYKTKTLNPKFMPMKGGDIDWL